MSCVHYKFSSKLNYDTVTFDGLHITVSELKRQIMGREKLKAADCDLQITNAQTKEEYTDDTALIPKNSSVIIRRIPIGGVKAASKTFLIDRSEPSVGSSKAVCNNSSFILTFHTHYMPFIPLTHTCLVLSCHVLCWDCELHFYMCMEVYALAAALNTHTHTHTLEVYCTVWCTVWSHWSL